MGVTCIEHRLDRLRKSIREKGFDTLMVLIEENRKYLSGFMGEDTQYDESAGALFITDQKLLLATDSRFEVQARREAPLYDIFLIREGLAASLPEILGMLHTRRLGFESARLSCLQYSKITEAQARANNNAVLIGTEKLVEAQRIVKEEGEIQKINAALRVAESAFERLIQVLRVDMTEKHAAWEMEKAMRECGADGLSFPTIAAFGPNSALPHAIPGTRRLQAGDPVLLDWGARLNGYCSDISRTLIIGKSDNTFENIYAVIQDAQQKAIESIRPGISGKSVDHVARTHIADRGYSTYFGHGLGHGVGLAVHEPPRLSPLSEDILEPGMVVTVEPGIYLPKWGGIRIENMVVVRENGAEVLNHLDTRPIMLL